MCRHSTKPQKKPKELIIPLIQKNRWCRPDRGADGDETKPQTNVSQESNSVESQAIKEIIEGVSVRLSTVYIAR